MRERKPESYRSLQVSSMHWGERDVKQWYEAEDRKKSYREELMQQVELVEPRASACL